MNRGLTENKSKKGPSNLREHSTEIAIGLGGFVLVTAAFVILMLAHLTKEHAEYAEHVGTFVGGYFGALFALVGVVLLYATLRNQRFASAQQGFETRYYELIKMHPDNVSEIGIKGRSGRRLFGAP